MTLRPVRLLAIVLFFVAAVAVFEASIGSTTVRAAAPSPTDTFASGFTKISVGYRHSCGVKIDGTVRCWGYNESRELGITTATYVYSAIPIEGLSGVIDIASGEKHSCALLDTGQVRCWGANGTGQLGDDTFESSEVPVTVIKSDGSPLTDVVQISAGAGFTCARLATGSVWCWGHAWGLGDDSEEDRGHAAPTIGFGVAIDIAAASFGWSRNVCAATVTGDVYCWGSDNWTGLRVGLPTKKDGVSGALSVMAGDRYSCATVAAFSFRCWGSNAKGQLGSTNISADLYSVPELTVESLGDGGGYTTCVVTTEKKAKCWGDGWNGRLGNGSTTDRTSPVFVKTDRNTELSNVAQVAIGEGNACALTTSGDVYCWGYMGYTARPWASWGTDETSYAGRIAENPALDLADVGVGTAATGDRATVTFRTNAKYCDFVKANFVVQYGLSSDLSDAESRTGTTCQESSIEISTSQYPGRTFYYRVSLASSFGNMTDQIRSFVARGKKPVLAMPPVFPSDSKARVVFEYDGDGLRASLGSCELSRNPDFSTSDVRQYDQTAIFGDGVERNIHDPRGNGIGISAFVCTYLNLTAETTYYYRTTVVNTAGTTTSGVRSFTTRKRSGVSLNAGALYTNSTKVSLSVVLPQIKAGSEVLVANDGGFAKSQSFVQGSEYPEFTTLWTLDSAGDERLPKTVYVRYTSALGESSTLTDDIILDTRSPVVDSASSGDTATMLALKIKASDDNSGLDDVQIRTNKSTVTVDYAASVSVTKKILGLSVDSGSLGAFAINDLRVRVSDKAGNWSSWESVSAGSISSSTSSTLTVGRSLAPTKVASLAKLKIAAGSKVSLKTTGTSTKVCRLVRGLILAASAGSCRVTVTVSPKSGKPTSKTVTIRINAK